MRKKINKKEAKINDLLKKGEYDNLYNIFIRVLYET